MPIPTPPEGLIPAAQMFGESYDTKIAETPISFGPPAWIFKDEDDSLAFRLMASSDLPDLYAKTITDKAVVDEWHAYADDPDFPFQKILGEPRVVGGYVATASPFVNGHKAETAEDYTLYGKALHDIYQISADPRRTQHARPFNPIGPIKKALSYLEERQALGQPVSVDRTTFPAELLPVFRNLVEKGEEKAEELREKAERHYPTIDILFDTNPANVIINDETKKAMVIDPEFMMRGWAFLDFARIEQWTRRLGRPAELGTAMMHAFEMSAGERFDPVMLALGSEILTVAHGMFGAAKVVEGHQLNQSPREKILCDIIDRLWHIDDPYYSWRSDIRLKTST